MDKAAVTAKPLSVTGYLALTLEPLQGGSVPVTRMLVGIMVKRLVEFPLEQGGSVLVEVDEPPAGPVMRGLGRDHPTLAERTDKTFEEATAAVTPATAS